MLHIVKGYETGNGHVEECTNGLFLVSFYGRRIVQCYAETLQEARFALRQLSKPAEGRANMAVQQWERYAASGHTDCVTTWMRRARIGRDCKEPSGIVAAAVRVARWHSRMARLYLQGQSARAEALRYSVHTPLPAVTTDG